MSEQFLKDPQAKLDWGFDWSDWLASGETIVSYVITADTGITVEEDAESGGVVTVWLLGGTAGQSYKCACKITTSAGRIDERTIRIRVDER